MIDKTNESRPQCIPSGSLSQTSLIENARKTIWHTRSDVRKLCNQDPLELDCWLALKGAREYDFLKATPFVPSPSVLIEPTPCARSDVLPTLTRFLHHLWRTRFDVQQSFPIETREGQQAFLWWYFLHGIAEYDISHLVTEEQKDFLVQTDPTVPPQPGARITRLMMELWRRHADVQAAFPIDTSSGQIGLSQWYMRYGREISGVGPLFDELKDRREKAPNSPSIAAPFINTTKATPGVNLIGFARGEFGIGEDVRMAAQSLRAAGVPCGIYNVDPGKEVTLNDHTVDGLITDKLPYPVNLFCMTGIDLANLVAKTGSELLKGHRNIGMWPWELPEWPKEWHHAYDLVDEVWATSRFTYEAFTRSCPKPVRHVPMAVTIETSAAATRASFGLPDDRFLFVFSFDALSSFTRKNPMACVESFKRAFPRGDEPVGLVVKAMRATPEHRAWQALMNEAARDQRIRVISETFNRGKLLDLYRACDCFVSLHRAEGFGRCIAEAMMLGKPVMVTGYSGNLDFATTATAALVDYRIATLTAEDYPGGAGQSWAEPDVGHAAWWMSRMAANRDLRTRLARQGQLQIIGAYAPEIVGQEYAFRLLNSTG